MTSLNKKFDIAAIIVICVFSSLVMFALSPINTFINKDSGVFLQVAKQWLSGDKLYTEIFDHKGPMLFWLNALPQIVIEGTIGVWILEAMLLLCCLLIIYKMAMHVTKDNRFFTYTLIFCYVVLAMFTYEGGNNSESYANFFSFIALLFLYRALIEGEKSTATEFIVVGMLFAVITMIRINNAAPFVSICAAIVLTCVIKKEFVYAARLSFAFLLGVFLVLMPILLYFYLQGSFYDFLYGSFLFNLEYSRVSASLFSNVDWEYAKNVPFLTNILVLYSTASIFYKVIMTLAVLLGCVIFIIAWLKRHFTHTLYGILSAFIMLVALSVSSAGFVHCLTIFLPQLIIGLLILYRYTNPTTAFSKLAALISVMLFVIGLSRVYVLHDEKAAQYQQFVSQSLELESYITDENEVFGYEMPAAWFLITKRFSPMRFFTLQNWLAQFDPLVTQEVMSFIQQQKPRVIVVHAKILTDTTENTILNYIQTHYSVYKENDLGKVYTLTQ